MENKPLTERVNAILASVKEEDQAHQGANPLAMIVDALGDTLCVPIYDKIVKLAGYRPQSDKDHTEMLQLHGEIVLFLNVVGYNNFQSEYIEEFTPLIPLLPHTRESLNSRMYETNSQIEEIERLIRLGKSYISDEEFKVRNKGSWSAGYGYRLDSEDVVQKNLKKLKENSSYRGALDTIKEREAIRRPKYNTLRRDGDMLKKLESHREPINQLRRLIQNQDPTYNPSVYMVRYNEWRAKRLVELVKDIGIDTNRLLGTG